MIRTASGTASGRLCDAAPRTSISFGSCANTNVMFQTYHLYFRWLQLRELGKSSIARLVCVHYYRYCCSCCCGCPRCENKFPRSSISASSIVTRKIIPVIPCALVHCRPRIILNDGVGATSVLGVRMRLRRWPNHWLCLSRW